MGEIIHLGSQHLKYWQSNHTVSVFPCNLVAEGQVAK